VSGTLSFGVQEPPGLSVKCCRDKWCGRSLRSPQIDQELPGGQLGLREAAGALGTELALNLESVQVL
jgi:hypothetical protein